MQIENGNFYLIKNANFFPFYRYEKHIYNVMS